MNVPSRKLPRQVDSAWVSGRAWANDTLGAFLQHQTLITSPKALSDNYAASCYVSEGYADTDSL